MHKLTKGETATLVEALDMYRCYAEDLCEPEEARDIIAIVESISEKLDL